MDEGTEVRGQFWVPGAEDSKVSGVLTLPPNEGGGRLELIGMLGAEEGFFEGSSRDISRILGQDEKTFYTLDGCIRSYGRITYGGPGSGGRQGFRVGQVIKNVHYGKDESVEVEALAVEMDWFLEWTERSGIYCDVKVEEERPTHIETRIIGETLDVIRVEAEFGRLELRHRINQSAPRNNSMTLSQEVYPWFKFDQRRSLASALDYASDLQDLVSIATQRPAAFRKVRFYDPSWDEEPMERGTILRAQLFSEWRVESRSFKKQLDDSGMLFTFEQLGGIDGVARWMTAAERHREVLGRVMATRYAKESMVQDEVLNRIASLEAFHRTWSGVGESQMNLVRRLEGLVDHAGEPFEKLVGAGKASVWCRKAKNHRNDIAHHLGRHPDLDVTELFYVGQAAYWLFIICMLREAHAPQEAFDHMVACRHFIWESSEIQGIL